MTDFGYNTIGTAGSDNPANNWVWCKATSTPASNGTLTSISVYADQRFGPAPTVALALYTDSSGAPSARVGTESSPVAVGASFAWVSATGLSLSVIAGTQYWFGIRATNYNGGASQNDVLVKFDTNGGATELYFAPATGTEPNLNAFPSSAVGLSGLGSATGERWSIYGTYTPSGTVKQQRFGTLWAVGRAATW